MKIAIDMKYTKSTPGTHVYNSEDKDAVIPTLYIKKAAMAEPLDFITINVIAKKA